MSRSISILMVSLFLSAPCLVAGVNLNVHAQGLAVPGGQATGPIDITANEQEFSGNQVIAKGNVRVKYKDSVVLAPMAALIRDASGNPAQAVFTGHPRLTQGLNKIDAETLVFEMASAKIVAQGRAHSEIVSAGGDDKAKPADGAVATDANQFSSEDPQQLATAAPANATTKTSKAPLEKVITDSDRQEYDRNTGRFEALGHVKVVHGNILVKSDKLSLVYGLDNKPETAVFTGNVTAQQDRNQTIADQMAYSLSTKRLQATGHVRSTVIQERKEDNKKSSNSISFGPPAQPAIAGEIQQPKDDIVIVTSETQDFSKQTGRLSANGNVKVCYQDTTGSGPQCVLLRNMQGKCERVIFSGRSQISQPGRRWIADRIEMTMEDRKVSASGNTKALIIQSPKPKRPPVIQYQMAGSKNQSLSANPNAEKPQ